VSKPVRRVVTSAAATALVLTMAACGGGDQATDKSASASSSTGATAGSTKGDQLSGEEFAGILKSALDKATTAHMTMDVGSNSGTAEGDADYTKTPPEAAIKMSVAELGGNVEVRMVGGTLYLKSASFGDKWVSASLDDPNSPLGSLGQQLDMTKTLQTFADSVVSATDEGTDDVDGESLKHYKATVDTQKLLSALSSASGADGSLPKTMDEDWWFDSDGLVRKFSSDFGGQAITLTLSDWGKDVSIEAPPSAQVTQMPATGAGGGGA
jgi:hypothetical protein